ncbi:MAG: pyruvate ferredoxin oxidoreductase [Candidatus Buchananbacteria bacterium RIFCSPHIGHO2_02_FULL_40_13]|uniref:Pyruvate ferredoxin oxidoreductase n=1 Tax=Candidatus Buchananbacteria bacterium RIFCSPLOWO2_01_FULL_39_33 TaxID=1797543 RepID=A0A1G1YIG8_9BACT|nr:MAG: pyruvate ferredoxin oxidoreductase [Candidatus Buchananbacteria bacterium RIFCSPHIGHO2_01_FULL_40_35]OGY49688.1 MAG: pyruvate ferredoxin oxidoreductase [Candidatus Buchananbacteria bacterium RIFCSPHIGHO2_02_FULL_40_13]OGY52138.1 MAG: pyruvate ferredoxin oxidoreductase [Candidatus Buchananbacteria bacterium RIFCSPLOWO2_01_FULL_39_33]
MVEIRIHGRGGQGSVTAAELVASAAFYDGQYSQGFPNFGVERRGAPVTAFVRIDDKFIRLRSQVYEPDYLIIQDPGLLENVDVFEGVKKEAVALINSEKPASEFKAPKGLKIKTIPATKLALKIIGQPIINTILLGAFAGLTGLIKLASVERAIKERFGDEEIIRKNIEAAKRGFELVKK